MPAPFRPISATRSPAARATETSRRITGPALSSCQTWRSSSTGEPPSAVCRRRGQRPRDDLGSASIPSGTGACSRGACGTGACGTGASGTGACGTGASGRRGGVRRWQQAVLAQCRPGPLDPGHGRDIEPPQQSRAGGLQGRGMAARPLQELLGGGIAGERSPFRARALDQRPPDSVRAGARRAGSWCRSPRCSGARARSAHRPPPGPAARWARRGRPAAAGPPAPPRARPAAARRPRARRSIGRAGRRCAAPALPPRRHGRSPPAGSPRFSSGKASSARTVPITTWVSGSWNRLPTTEESSPGPWSRVSRPATTQAAGKRAPVKVRDQSPRGPQQGRFARPRVAGQHDQLSGGDLEAELAQRRGATPGYV